MSPLDALLLVVILVSISAYGLLKSYSTQKHSVNDVLIGSKVSVFSVALSVCSGFISSISLLGFPAEVYYHGAMIYWYGLMYCIAFPIVAFVFLPTFYNLKITSLYQYLELRFDTKCRSAAAFLFCLQIVLYNAVALYAPSLALSSMTGIALAPSVCLTATLSAVYISVGGARAGIHTSAVQMLLIFGVMTAVIASGLAKTGFTEITSVASRDGRLDMIDFRLDPRVRHSFWSLIIGGTGNILCLFAANQLSMQRYMAMPSLKQAQRVVLLNIVCNGLVLSCYVFLGLLVYAAFHCHPDVKSSNELLVRFVTEHAAFVPGIVGLFAAAIYSAAISTLSGSFSAISVVVIEDVIKTARRASGLPALTDPQIINTTRILPLVCAAVCTSLAIACGWMKAMILQISFSVFGAVGGPVLGIFVCGLFVPRVRARAALFGLATATLATFSVSIGGILAEVRPVALPLRCSNSTAPAHSGYVAPFDATNYVQPLRVSYQYYSIIGLVVNVISSLVFQIVSDLFTDRSSSSIENRLLSPFVRHDEEKSNELPHIEPLIEKA